MHHRGRMRFAGVAWALAAACLSLPAYGQSGAPEARSLLLYAPVGAAPHAAWPPAMAAPGMMALGAARPAPVLGMTLAGAAGVVGGFLAGGYTALALAGEGDCGEENLCLLGWVVVGGGIGEVIGAPLGVHLANKGRGSFGLDLAVSAAGLVGGVLIGQAVAPDAAPLVGVAVQLGAIVYTETVTSRRARAGQ